MGGQRAVRRISDCGPGPSGKPSGVAGPSARTSRGWPVRGPALARPVILGCWPRCRPEVGPSARPPGCPWGQLARHEVARPPGGRPPGGWPRAVRRIGSSWGRPPDHPAVLRLPSGANRIPRGASWPDHPAGGCPSAGPGLGCPSVTRLPGSSWLPSRGCP